ncbi:MAG: MBL fold metallo-hydrolase [Pseudomonadales bacterium]
MPSSAHLRSCLRINLMLILLQCTTMTAAKDLSDARGSTSTVYYLANAGLMVSSGNSKVLFDPLFNQSYGQYTLLPASMKQALFRGLTPFDNINAIFVSHSHGDHFAPEEMLKLLRRHPAIKLYGPTQVMDALKDVMNAVDKPILKQLNEIRLEYGDKPVAYTEDELLIEAVRIPHSGWPGSRRGVQNISFRITFNNGAADEKVTVLHLGDADTKDYHFAQDKEYWAKRTLDIAFPPYWYFSSRNGREVLEERLKPTYSIGVHVPSRMPSDPKLRPQDFQSRDLFTVPGETRILKTGQTENRTED